MNGRPLILEGLTGTGKSSTIEALRARGIHVWFDEVATFDDHMDRWLEQPAMPAAERTQRLDSILDHISAVAPRRANDTTSIIERFHLSYFALDGDWSIYDGIDERAANLGIRLVLLDVPDDALAKRCLYRQEYGHTDWQSLGDIYGSEQAALEALRCSQQRRRDALGKTRLPSLTIDTTAMDWAAYADRIIAFAGSYDDA
jgi:thymidylate kinase